MQNHPAGGGADGDRERLVGPRAPRGAGELRDVAHGRDRAHALLAPRRREALQADAVVCRRACRQAGEDFCWREAVQERGALWAMSAAGRAARVVARGWEARAVMRDRGPSKSTSSPAAGPCWKA